MNRKQRTFFAALCLLLLPGALQSSDQTVCPKSSPPAKTLWAVRIQDLPKDSEERLPLSCPRSRQPKAAADIPRL